MCDNCEKITIPELPEISDEQIVPGLKMIVDDGDTTFQRDIGSVVSKVITDLNLIPPAPDGVNYTGYFISNASVPINDGASLLIPFPTIRFDPKGMANVGDATKFTIKKAGFYEIGAGACLATDGKKAQVNIVRYRTVNGLPNVLIAKVGTVYNNDQRSDFKSYVSLNVDDQISVSITNQSGSNDSLNYNPWTPFLFINLLSA